MRELAWWLLLAVAGGLAGPLLAMAVMRAAARWNDRVWDKSVRRVEQLDLTGWKPR